MMDDSQRPEVRKIEIRKTTIVLTFVALAFYGGFILMGVVKAGAL